MLNNTTLCGIICFMSSLYEAALQARHELVNDSVDRGLLYDLFETHSPGPGAEVVVDAALHSFPHLSCDVASVYLRHVLQEGSIVNGKYISTQKLALPHTFLMTDELVVIDITADQFGGPEIYVGPPQEPWLQK
jgi:hypothetical protein